MNNQLIGAGFGYDGNSNPMLYKGVNLSFDPENRMTAYGNILTTGYNGDGLRAWKQTASGRRYYLYDGEELVCELDAAGNAVAGVVFGANGLVVYDIRGYQFDPQGNATHLMDDDGLVLAHLAYDAWGQRMSGENPTPYGYKGQWGYYTDGETGLLLLTHRYLDPATGRFLTRDPAGCEASVNLYAYVGNNTINESDPSGYQRQYKPPKYAGEYQHCISEGIEKHCKGVGAPNATLYAWIWCIIHGESSWNPEARNPKTGATGCMQIIPKYHDEQCKKAGYPDWQTNPCENIKCGTMLLCNCLRDHKGNIQKCKRLYDAIGREEFNKCMKHQYYSAK